MKAPEEDPKDKRDRRRERRMSLIERRNAAQRTAEDLTTDVSRVYGLGGLRGLGQTGTIGMSRVGGGSVFDQILAARDSARQKAGLQ